MDRDILFQSDHRSLSSSAANDFSLYGAQPEPGLTFGPAGLTSGESFDGAPATEFTDGVASTPTEPLAPLPAAQSAAPGELPSAPSGLQPVLLTQSSTGSTAIAHDPVPLTSALIPAALPAIGPEPAFANATIPGVTSAPSVAPVTTATTPAEQVAAPLITTLPPVVTELSTPLQDVTGGLLDPVVSILPVLGGVLDNALDGVQDLLGSDPAGGIATLVNLVTIDVIDLGDVIAAPLEAVATVPTDLIDLLADDAGETAPLPVDLDDGPIDDLLDPILTAVPLPGLHPLPDPTDLFGP